MYVSIPTYRFMWTFSGPKEAASLPLPACIPFLISAFYFGAVWMNYDALIRLCTGVRR